MFDHTRTVSEVTSYISTLFDMDDILSDVWVSGEVSNMTRAKSGHWYFTLKDQDAQLRCVMWRSQAARQTVVPNEGDAVEVHGRVGIYAPRGEYQLYADALRPIGQGDLHQQFERLKARLQAEGLFDADRKRDMPHFPLTIGVVTSPNAAAFQDILNVLSRRFPLAQVILSPTKVQGADAPPAIIRALERLNTHDKAEIILLCRGGGSIEDLWAFNDEGVARAVVASSLPVITGVGHETDFTIVDFVSDLRAPTPSAAAELAVPSVTDLRQSLLDRTALLSATLDDQLATHHADLDALNRTLSFRSPLGTIQDQRQRIDDLSDRLGRSQNTRLERLSERLTARQAALEAASPQAILKRGYAIVTRTHDDKRIVSELDTQPGDAITIQLRDGNLKARVEDEDTHERYQRTLF